MDDGGPERQGDTEDITEGGRAVSRPYVNWRSSLDLEGIGQGQGCPCHLLERSVSSGLCRGGGGGR